MEIQILFHKGPDLLDQSTELRTLRFHPFLLCVLSLADLLDIWRTIPESES